jgi:hypothetical protein
VTPVQAKHEVGDGQKEEVYCIVAAGFRDLGDVRYPVSLKSATADISTTRCSQLEILHN